MIQPGHIFVCSKSVFEGVVELCSRLWLVVAVRQRDERKGSICWWQPFFLTTNENRFMRFKYVRYSSLLQCLNFEHEFWENNGSEDWFMRAFTYKMYVRIESEHEKCWVLYFVAVYRMLCWLIMKISSRKWKTTTTTTKNKTVTHLAKRNITAFGKITVFNTLVISKINHQFMNVPDPDEKILHDLNLLLYDFLFDGKYDKINVSVVCQDPAAGGLKMVDVKSFLSVWR